MNEIIEDQNIDLVPAEAKSVTASVVFEHDKMAGIIDAIRKKARSHKPDLTTNKGRKAIASIAAKVAKSKTFLDKLGKDLVAGKKAEVKLIDDERKIMRDSLSDLKDEVRKPLTDWEDAENERRERITSTIEKIRMAGIFDVVFQEIPLATIQSRQEEVEAIVIGDDFGEFKEMAESTKENSLNTIGQMIAQKKQYDKDQAELAKLREAEEKRKAEEAKKAEEKKRRARERELKAEARKKAEEKSARKIAVAKEAEEKAKREKIEAEGRAEREKKEAVAAAERKAKEEAEEKEKSRLAKIEEKRLVDEKRAADKKHRASIQNDVAMSLVKALDIEASLAYSILHAIDSGEIAHTTIKY
jgi:septal ring factor EnvC (AmiA/AmiB activator)